MTAVVAQPSASLQHAPPPLPSKLLVAAAIQAFFIAFMISYFGLSPAELGIDRWIHAKCVEQGLCSVRQETGRTTGNNKVFTAAELAKYDGSTKGKGPYLALVGRVFDVSAGAQHYGPGGGYHFFSGKDATRAFVTGDFTKKGLVADTTGLSEQDYLGIDEWLHFYEKDYLPLGVLDGTYYDSKGRPTAAAKALRQSVAAAKKWREQQKRDAERFPACNSEWSQNKGGRVWCTNKSGGVKRDWAGVPRRMFKAGSKDYRCVCIKNTGPPTDGSDPKGNRGDLDMPSLKLYPGCKEGDVSCNTKD